MAGNGMQRQARKHWRILARVCRTLQQTRDCSKPWLLHTRVVLWMILHGPVV